MKTAKMLCGIVLVAGFTAMIAGCGVFYARQNTSYKEHKIEAQPIQRLSVFTEIESRREITLCAHRGLSATAPENSLQAIREAGEAGFPQVFLDVLLTKDKVPVVFFDTTIDRMTTGTGRVSTHTFEELQRYPLDNGAHVESFPQMFIPSLEQALKVCAEYRLTPVLHVRSKDAAETAAETAKRFGAPYIMASSDREILEKAQKGTDVAGWYMVESVTESEVAFAKEKELILVFDAAKKTNADPILRKAQGEVELCAYCVNRRESMRRFAELGIRNMVTDSVLPAIQK